MREGMRQCGAETPRGMCACAVMRGRTETHRGDLTGKWGTARGAHFQCESRLFAPKEGDGLVRGDGFLRDRPETPPN